MAHTLLVNTTPEERRVALVEGGALREFYTEHRYDRGLAGNIYKGRVVRVMPGMEAAFVEIGVGRAGFLQPGSAAFGDESGEEGRKTGGLEVGRDVLVQVEREPIGSKGPRLTTELSLAGRTLVFLPTTSVLGVSRRITDEQERERLKTAVAGLLPEGTGVVLRTASMGRPDRELADDLSFLSSLWERISRFASDSAAPALIHEDLDLLLRTARDLLTDGCEKMIVDTEEDYDRLLQFVDSFTPHLNPLVERYDGERTLYDHFGIDTAVSGLLDRKVWLKSGGSIVFDHTEALTAIDVNTGSSSSRGDPAATILKTNLEAAREIADQLRLRNIGGIVVIDFVDLDDPDDRTRVYDTLSECLARDKASTDVLPMSRFGLVELTRRRLRKGALTQMTESCPYCDGRGWILSVDQVCADIVRKVAGEIALPRCKGVIVQAHPRVIETLVETYRTSLADMETQFGKPVRLARRDDAHIEGYVIRRD